MSKQKNEINNSGLPKSLFGFYLRHGVRGHWALLGIWLIAFVGVSFDNVIFPMVQRMFIALFEQPMPVGVSFVEFVLPSVLMMIGMLFAVDICNVVRDWGAGRWSPIIRNQISEVLTDYAHMQSMRFWTGALSGKVYSQINYIADGFRVIPAFARMLTALVVMGVDVVLTLHVNKYVAIIFAFAFVFRIVYGILIIRPMNRSAERASESSSTVSGKIVDSISNYIVVKLFSGRRKEAEYLKPLRTKKVKDIITSSFWQRMFWAVPAIVWNLCFGATMLLCAYLFSHGAMKISEIVFTLSIFMSVMHMIARIVDEIPNIVDSIGSATKSYRELVKPIDVMDVPNAPDLRVTRGEIEIHNVSFKYKNKYVLRNFSLKIRPGERVGFVGASGAGKTTLVNLIMRFYDPTCGEIRIDGQDIRYVTQDSLRQNIAFIPQEPTMFNRTLRENIAYGRPGATDADVRRASRLAAADKFIMATDNKYDSRVGDRGIKLSGGQRQRIAIARAFVKDAPILILDEATSALDSETEIAIQNAFDKLAAGRTTIAIAHRLSTLRNMDRIVVISDGHVIEMGSHKQLLRKNGEYARLWKMQSGGFLQDSQTQK